MQFFEDRVIVVERDPFHKEHKTLEVPSLHVMKFCPSLCSRGNLEENLSWKHYYNVLTKTET